MAAMDIKTPDEVLSEGLALYGFDEARQAIQNRKSNLNDFKAHFGVSPVVVAQVWEDLQTTAVTTARIEPTGNINLVNLLHALHFLTAYPLERVRKGQTGNCRKTLRKWGWYFIKAIMALKAVKVSCCFGAPRGR